MPIYYIYLDNQLQGIPIQLILLKNRTEQIDTPNIQQRQNRNTKLGDSETESWADLAELKSPTPPIYGTADNSPAKHPIPKKSTKENQHCKGLKCQAVKIATKDNT